MTDGHGLLTGKRVLVTAAAGTGIGFATAERCLAEGATVAISDKHERRLAEAAERLGGVPAVPCDVTQQADVDRLFAEAGDVDGLVNKPGVGGPAHPGDNTPEQGAGGVDVTPHSTL